MSELKKYRFMIAWIDGSNSADEPTGVFKPSDLEPEFEKGNPHVNSKVIRASNAHAAHKEGIIWAFFENFTARDTVSDVVEIEEP